MTLSIAYMRSYTSTQYFDETWKAEEFGGVEGHWGLFYSKYVTAPASLSHLLTAWTCVFSRTLKDITIPTCS